MKLELKHIAPYLPYGLQIDISNYKCDYVGIKKATANGYYFIGDELHVTYNGGHTGKDVGIFKPILRPMSDLTKSIEQNGERFTPLIYLYNISNSNPHDNELNFELIDSWGAGKILKVLHYNKADYTKFIYSDLSFRKDTHHEKGFYRYGMHLPHSITV